MRTMKFEVVMLAAGAVDGNETARRIEAAINIAAEGGNFAESDLGGEVESWSVTHTSTVDA